MRLISIDKIVEGCMLPRTWVAIVSGNNHLGFALYIPWIFHSSYHDPLRRLDRCGWRIPRILFQVRLFQGISFSKFFWCEAI